MKIREIKNDSFISASSFKTYLNCAQKYKYHREGIVSKTSSVAMVFGKAIHLGLDELYKKSPIEKAQKVFKDYFESNIEDMEKVKKRNISMGEEILAEYQKIYKNMFVDEIEYEKPFAIPLKDSKYIYGFFDKTIVIGKKWWIIDHKTTTKKLEGKYLIPFEQDPQTLFYLLAGKYIYKEKFGGIYYDHIYFNETIVRGIEVNFRLQRIEYGIDITLERLNSFIEEVSLIMDEISNKKIAVKNSQNCQSIYGQCEYYNECFHSFHGNISDNLTNKPLNEHFPDKLLLKLIS